MKKYTSQLVTSLLILIAIAVPLMLSTTAGAIDLYPACAGVDENTAVCSSKGDKADSLVKTVVNTLLYVLGAIAVIMIVVGGIRYTTSNGDANSIKSAKDTILYSVIGLVVAMMAWAIVNFVVTQFG